MKAIIKWPGGENVIENAHLGDPRIAEYLDMMAGHRWFGPTSLTFVDEGDCADFKEKLYSEEA